MQDILKSDVFFPTEAKWISNGDSKFAVWQFIGEGHGGYKIYKGMTYD